MPVTKLEISNRQPYADGQYFGDSGAYERIDGMLHYAVDPDHPTNAGIVDLQLAPRASDGLVHFSGDLCLLKPVDSDGGSRRLLAELPNRGRKLAPRQFNRAMTEVPPKARILPGDGFLFRHGWSIAWVGWQWDVVRDGILMGLDAPEAEIDHHEHPHQVMIEIRPNLHDHVRLLANRIHQPYPVADLDDPDATLTVRDWEDGPREEIPADQWRFAQQAGDELTPSHHHLYLEPGFEPGKIYEVTYRTDHAPVVGCGLLAARDAAAFLKYRERDENPLAGMIDHVYSFGMSQTGRMQRHFLSLGLNVDRAGRQVYDGMLIHVAGGRRGEFNHRYGQPSVQATPGFGHRYPFADQPVEDPVTHREIGLLDLQRGSGGTPKIFYTNSSAEYWRGDASLLHIDPTGERDLDPAPESRIYLFAGTQHGPGGVPQTRYNPNDGSRGRYGFNTVEYSPLLRAALINLDRWASEGVEPPPSQHPRLDDGTATTRDAVLRGFSELPDMALPDPDRLPVLRAVDLGPEEEQGIGRYPAVESETYPAYVAALDEDDNEVAGIRLPDLTVPLGTHAGWNPRAPETGAPEQIMPMQGFTLWFARTPNEATERGDLRAPISGRYENLDDYLDRVRVAAEGLVQCGYLLTEDVDLVVADAEERWHTVIDSD